MKDKALIPALVMLILVMVGLLTGYVATRTADAPTPSREIVEQSVVTAPPMRTVMGGPPAADHAAR